jgi:hypothetical protein
VKPGQQFSGSRRHRPGSIAVEDGTTPGDSEFTTAIGIGKQ